MFQVPRLESQSYQPGRRQSHKEESHPDPEERGCQSVPPSDSANELFRQNEEGGAEICYTPGLCWGL